MRLITKTKDDLDKSVVNDAGEYVDDVEDGDHWSRMRNDQQGFKVDNDKMRDKR